jgi:hypothetical protein
VIIQQLGGRQELFTRAAVEREVMPGAARAHVPHRVRVEAPQEGAENRHGSPGWERSVILQKLRDQDRLAGELRHRSSVRAPFGREIRLRQTPRISASSCTPDKGRLAGNTRATQRVLSFRSTRNTPGSSGLIALTGMP